MGWIVRIIFILSAPIAALLVSRDALNFGLIQTLVAVLVVTSFVALGALWSARRPRARP
jgi:hypothetical protein